MCLPPVVNLGEPKGRELEPDLGVPTQVKLWLIEDPPPARAALNARVGANQLIAQVRGGEGMWARRTRTDEELPVDQLPDHVLGERCEISIGRLALGLFGFHVHG